MSKSKQRTIDFHYWHSNQQWKLISKIILYFKNFSKFKLILINWYLLLQRLWVWQNVSCSSSSTSSFASWTSTNASIASKFSFFWFESKPTATAGTAKRRCWQKAAGTAGSTASGTATGQLCSTNSPPSVWQSQGKSSSSPAANAATTAYIPAAVGSTATHHGKDFNRIYSEIKKEVLDKSKYFQCFH